MTLREFLNAIFSFIGSESLTDGEYDSLPSGLTQAYDADNYEALKAVLIARESISLQYSKLKAFFVAKGLIIQAVARPPTSQILFGASLD